MNIFTWYPSKENFLFLLDNRILNRHLFSQNADCTFKPILLDVCHVKYERKRSAHLLGSAFAQKCVIPAPSPLPTDLNIWMRPQDGRVIKKRGLGS